MSKRSKIGKISKFGSKYFRTTGNNGKRGKINKNEKFWSKYSRTPGNKSKRGKIGKIAKFGSKFFRTTGNKGKRGKISKIENFWSKYSRTHGSKSKRGNKIGKIAILDQNISGPLVIIVREVKLQNSVLWSPPSLCFAFPLLWPSGLHSKLPRPSALQVSFCSCCASRISNSYLFKRAPLAHVSCSCCAGIVLNH